MFGKGFFANVAVGGITTATIAAMRVTPMGWGVSMVGGALGGVIGQWVDDGAITPEGALKGGISGAVGGLLGWGAGRAFGSAIGKMSSRAARHATRGALVGLVSALVREGYNAFDDFGTDPDAPQNPGDKSPETGLVPLKWSGLAAASAAGLFGRAPFVTDPAVQAQGSGFLLHPVKLNPAIATWYGGPANSFASSLAENYKMFGDLEKKEELDFTPIRALSVPAGVASQGEAGTGYTQAVQAMNTAAQNLNQKQSALAKTLKDVEEITKTGQENIASLITRVNGSMGSIPAGDVDGSFLGVLQQAVGEAAGIMDQAAADAELAARTIGNPDLNTTPSGANLADAVGRFESGVGNSALWPDSSDLTSPPDLDQLIPDDLDPENPAKSELGEAIDRLQQASNPLAANPNPAAAMPATDPSANMMNSMMSSMLPMMMQQMMSRQMADDDMAGRRADLDPSRYEPEPEPAPIPARPAGTTPWSAQNAAATSPAATQQTPPHTHTGPSSGATSTQQGGRTSYTPGEDGSVVYTFPDGRTQKVSPTVAKVLDKAFANIKSTDAQEAYAETEAKWTDRKEIGQRVDPFELMTGDVATWDDRTAVLVVFGSGEEGTLEVIVNGEVQPFEPEMSDSAGEFGQFTGFVHPPGIEVGGSKDAGSDGVSDTGGDNQNSAQTGETALAVPA